ncbi:MAG: hypothetical protein LUO97_04305 [Methanomicrobiales archaeon]|nr:hypothetical protein [Methanomicrobiales archaeon]
MTAPRSGRITGISGNMVTVRLDSPVMQNEVASILYREERLKAEVIRVRGRLAELQVYVSSAGLKVVFVLDFLCYLVSV